jgi:hypothetical protein
MELPQGHWLMMVLKDWLVVLLNICAMGRGAWRMRPPSAAHRQPMRMTWFCG